MILFSHADDETKAGERYWDKAGLLVVLAKILPLRSCYKHTMVFCTRAFSWTLIICPGIPVSRRLALS